MNLQPQQPFSFFTYHEDDSNNFQSSFLNTLSSILDDNENNNETPSIVPNNQPLEIQKEGSDEEQQEDSNDSSDHSVDGSVDRSVSQSRSSSSSSNSSEASFNGSEQEEENVQFEDEESDLDDTRLFKTVKSKKVPKAAKIVPLPLPTKKSVQFHGADEVKEIEVPDVEIPETRAEEGPEEELQSLVKQLVRLETEETRAKEFLEFIQRHACFDKQDHGFVRQFLEQIEKEKHSLYLVLSNYGSHLQPLITMMTIAERRLELLDSTQLLTPNSSLHLALLDKQQMLQAVIAEATNHVYQSKR